MKRVKLYSKKKKRKKIKKRELNCIFSLIISSLLSIFSFYTRRLTLKCLTEFSLGVSVSAGQLSGSLGSFSVRFVLSLLVRSKPSIPFFLCDFKLSIYKWGGVKRHIALLVRRFWTTLVWFFDLIVAVFVFDSMAVLFVLFSGSVCLMFWLKMSEWVWFGLALVFHLQLHDKCNGWNFLWNWFSFRIHLWLSTNVYIFFPFFFSGQFSQ